MIFSKWIFQESTIDSLFQKTLSAFPSCRKRQHSIDEIKITELNWTPYLGLKTLFIKGLATNIANKKQYNSVILFKNINYTQNENSVQIVASNGRNYSFEKIKESTDVLLRCSCPDHYYRSNYYAHLDHSLWGPKRRKYESKGLWTANPSESPILCKHLIKLILALENAGIFDYLPFHLKD